MTSSILRKLGLAALAFSGLTVLAADPPRPAAPPPPADDVASLPHPLRAKQVLGAKISIQNNTAIGTVDDIVLSDGGDVEYVVVQTGDNKMITVPWSTVVWGKDFKTASVNISPEQYKVIPTYSTTTYPEYFTPTYRTEVYKYYGATPGTLRRIIRR